MPYPINTTRGFGMEKQVVAMHQNEPRVCTFDIFKRLGYKEHRAVKKVIYTNEKHFLEYGFLHLHVQKPTKGSKGGRPDESYLLNENQFTLLTVLCKNSPEVVEYKVKIVRQFVKMRTFLTAIASQRQNSEWLETRNAGKQKRRVETDTIQKFVSYAVAQGSKNAEKYYANISKMQNKALFFIEQKFKNIREILNLKQLSIVICADEIVTKAIDDGMAKDMHYKDVYQLAKKRIESFADLHGKTLIPAQFKQLT